MINHNQILRQNILYKYWIMGSCALIIIFGVLVYNANAFKIATYSRALILAAKGDDAYKDNSWGDSGVLFLKALPYSPEPEKIKFNLANTYYQQGRYKEAVAMYDSLLTNKNSPLQATILNNQGNAYFKKGSLFASIEAYKSALVLKNDDDTVRQNLLYVFAQYEKMLKSGRSPDGTKKGDSKKEGTKKDDTSNKDNGGEKAPLDEPQSGKYQVSDRAMESLLKISKEQERVPQGARSTNKQTKKAENNGPDY
jgi:tetratricopeptide (TPR) repeat protein